MLTLSKVAAQFPDVPDADDGELEQPPSSASSSTGSVTPVSKHEVKVKKERKRNLTGEDSPNRGPGLGNRVQRGVYKAITAAKDPFEIFY